MKIAIMQPYLLPYIGYMQMMAAADIFVLFDNVNFIKRGFSNRNSLLLNEEKHTFTLSLNKPSQNKTYRETYLVTGNRNREELLKTIAHAYSKAPEFEKVFPLVQDIFTITDPNALNFAEFIYQHFQKILQFYNIETKLVFSSQLPELPKNISANHPQKKALRLIQICQELKGDTYINAPGGKALYEKEFFAQHDINLHFIEPDITPYQQFGSTFVPYLSFLDIMMFNTPQQVKHLLETYSFS